MKSKFGAFLPVILIIAIILSLWNAVYTQLTLSSLTEVSKPFNAARAIGRELDPILTKSINIGLRHHAFLIAGRQEDKTAVFSELIPGIHGHIQKLKELTGDNEKERNLVDAIAKNFSKIESSLREEVALRETQGITAVSEFHFSRYEGNALSLLINDVRDLRQMQRDVVDRREMQVARSYRMLSTMTLVSNTSNIFLLVLFYYFIIRELRSRNREEKLKDDFINMASHELKTPVTSLKIFTHVLSKKLQEGKVGEAKRYISKLDGQMNKLTLLISDLLDVSRIQTGKIRFEKEGFNINALIDETVEELSATSKQHDIIVKGSINRMVYADRYRIYQVLVNLLTNAIKYSPDGGKIIVSMRVENNYAIVSVKDSGIGIDQKYQKKIFDRLYQVTDAKEKTYPGLGVGLYVSAFIIKEHDGEIWVDSEKGKGSTFYFSLPLGE